MTVRVPRPPPPTDQPVPVLRPAPVRHTQAGDACERLFEDQDAVLLGG
jgi:hypothetical protein